LIAQWGGYLNRQNDAPPGHHVVWNGDFRLSAGAQTLERSIRRGKLSAQKRLLVLMLMVHRCCSPLRDWIYIGGILWTSVYVIFPWWASARTMGFQTRNRHQPSISSAPSILGDSLCIQFSMTTGWSPMDAAQFALLLGHGRRCFPCLIAGGMAGVFAIGLSFLRHQQCDPKPDARHKLRHNPTAVLQRGLRE